MPEAALALDHAVAGLREVAAEGLAEGLPAADAPAQRPVELGHPGRQRLERRAPVSRARSSASRIRFWANPRPRYSGRVPTHITPFIGSWTEP